MAKFHLSGKFRPAEEWCNDPDAVSTMSSEKGGIGEDAADYTPMMGRKEPVNLYLRLSIDLGHPM